MYRPLPDGITVKESAVQGLGLFATKDFDADVVLGIVHIKNKNFPHGYIRTALGAKDHCLIMQYYKIFTHK